ncbi:butyrate kinase [Pelosinus propionicus]|uniref:Probable butyrate kinase n=1 Tax=Pelosinus propionicus DSM 13327 TaxID=1123291 RepID=A0A1I4IIM8_9FIRM|nr:butyrate kinase [Pelosinus propionicus]SFL54168.1 butyrate kinase [Pelosinus propionicus DSM 13327]
MIDNCLLKERILVINPGATSTKFAVYDGETLIIKRTVEHLSAEINAFVKLLDQYEYRLRIILKQLAAEEIELSTLTAIAARGGILKPLKGGTYEITQEMVDDLREAKRGEHASNLGAVMAFGLASLLKIPSYIVDPVSVDEMEPVARISGLPDLPRISLSHALNTKAVARKVAKQLGKKYEEMNLIVAHLGTGISVTPHRLGRMIDVNNPKEEGPLSPDRCGGLPVGQFLKLAASGIYTFDELKEILNYKGGMYAYLGTADIREDFSMASSGNQQANLILEALSYQVAKEIGGMATVLSGQVECIILTGGIAHSEPIVNAIISRVQFIAPVIVIPGEEELEALAFGTLRVLQGEEQAQMYSM